MLLELLFSLSILVILYIYAGYPVMVWIFGKLIRNPVSKKPFEPTVSIIIAAYNEAACIASTLNNKLSLNYPMDKTEIIVVSDSSNDGTDEQVAEFASQGVKLLRQETRQGKTAALNRAVPEARGEIIAFSDANSLWDPQALAFLMENFADPRVGYVSGKMIYTNPDGTPIGDGCSAYMKYENLLRSWETEIGSIVGVDGGIDAARKNLFRPMEPDQIPDFVLPLKVIDQGFRVVYEPRAILKEASLGKSSDEYRMRTRVSLRAFWALYDMRHLLTFTRSIIFSWQLWSHKVLRYVCFFFLVAAFVLNLFLIPHGIPFLIFLVIQILAYTGAVVSLIGERINIRIRPLYAFQYFVVLNIAAAHAFMKFLFRQKTVVWTPRKG